MPTETELRNLLNTIIQTSLNERQSPLVRLVSIEIKARYMLDTMNAKRDAAPTIAKQFNYEDDGSILFSATTPRARMAP